MSRRPPRSTLSSSSAASDVYKRQREGGVEIVVEELCTRMVNKGHKVTCYNRGGHHVSGKKFDSAKIKNYKGINLKTVPTINCKGLAAMYVCMSGMD